MYGLVGWGFWGFWGFLGFRGEMKDHKINNVVTQNTSGKEEKAVAIIAEVGSH